MGMLLEDLLHVNSLTGAEQFQRSLAGTLSRSRVSVGEMVGRPAVGVVVGSDVICASGVIRTGLMVVSYLVGSGAEQATKNSKTNGVKTNLYKTYLWFRDSIPSLRCGRKGEVGIYLTIMLSVLS